MKKKDLNILVERVMGNPDNLFRHSSQVPNNKLLHCELAWARKTACQKEEKNNGTC